MKLLTPELVAHSYGGVTNNLESQELDFDLSRRMGIIINRVIGTMEHQNGSAAFIVCPAHQELDLDPDNADILGGHPAVATEGFVRDSTRIFVQKSLALIENTATQAGYQTPVHRAEVSWLNLPMNQRPIAINNLRHSFEIAGDGATSLIVWLTIYYMLVELSDQEIGLTAILRR